MATQRTSHQHHSITASHHINNQHQLQHQHQHGSNSGNSREGVNGGTRRVWNEMWHVHAMKHAPECACLHLTSDVAFPPPAENMLLCDSLCCLINTISFSLISFFSAAVVLGSCNKNFSSETVRRGFCVCLASYRAHNTTTHTHAKQMTHMEQHKSNKRRASSPYHTSSDAADGGYHDRSYHVGV